MGSPWSGQGRPSRQLSSPSAIHQPLFEAASRAGALQPWLSPAPYGRNGPLSVRPALSGETPRSAEPPRRAGLSRRRAFRHIGRSRSLPYAVARELEGSMIEAGVMGLAAVFAAVIVLAGSSRA